MLNESADSVANSPASAANAAPPQYLPRPTLLDLAPHYDPSVHAGYLHALLEGIKNGHARNIALSGPYGTGKSSILEGLKMRFPDQTIQVSLATVRHSVDESRNPPSERPGDGKRTEPSANDLQKEIVKQILYILDPAKMPASRFPRTSKFRWSKNLWRALLAGLTGVAIQWIVTLILATVQQGSALVWNPGPYIPTMLSVTLIALIFLRITNGRLAISGITAGPAKLTLADTTGSYFDDYLDEIVYFFQVSKTRILVLEDMDRFNNVEVFEDLRALNVLLNHSAQLNGDRLHGKTGGFWDRLLSRRPWKKPEEIDLAQLEKQTQIPRGFHDGPIVFVYAIRDSLLTKTVEALGEVQHDAFTRTKFFDLIIPVVPFISKQNARGALKRELEMLSGSKSDEPVDATKRPSNELVRKVAQHFPDQRQIRNIRNEFLIYRDRLLQPGNHPDELNPDRLFALILYKNLEVADFELIRLGGSNLHYLQRLGRALVLENLERINLRLSHPAEAALQAQASQVAQQILEKTRALGMLLSNDHPTSQTRQQQKFEELRKLEKWRAVVAGENLQFSNGKNLDRRAIETAFSVSLSFAEESTVPLDAEERVRLEENREILETATWKTLWEHPQFTLSAASAAWREEGKPNRALSFSQIVIEVFKEGLAADLIASDYLTKNFAILSAHFDGQFLGVEAQNFIQNSVDHPGRSPLTPISDHAINEILKDRTDLVLGRSGMVNIHVLNYLLIHAPDKSDRLLAQLRSWTDEDADFVRDFFSRYGNDADITVLRQAITYLASLTSEIIHVIVNDPSLSDERKASLFDAALAGSQLEQFSVFLAGDETIRHYAQLKHADFDSLKHDNSEVTAASRLVLLGTTIEDLGPLSEPVRDLFIEAGLFAMTVPNLSVIIGQQGASWVSLEELRTVPAAYMSTLRRIKEYLKLLKKQDSAAEAMTAESPTVLAVILADLLKEHGDSGRSYLQEVTRHASSSLRVPDITQLDGTVQEILLQEHRAEVTTANLLARFDSSGTVTEGIATALHNNLQSLTPPLSSDDTDLSTFVEAVLIATAEHPEHLTEDVISEFIPNIYKSVLDIDELIEIPAVTLLKSSPSVALRLINDGRGNLEDLRATADSTVDWSVREALLASNSDLDATDIGKLVSPDDVPTFLENQKIHLDVRAHVQFHLTSLLTAPHGTQNANKIAGFFRSHEISLDLNAIHALADAGASREHLIALLIMPEVREEFATNMEATLKKVGGDYAAIVDEGPNSPKFAATSEHRRFLEILKDFGILKRFKSNADGMLGITRIFSS